MNQPKHQAQAFEIERLLKSAGISLDELADAAGVNRVTMKRLARGYQKAGAHTMKSIRQAATIPVYASRGLKESGGRYGPPSRRLRYIPVVSWAKAGEATDYDDLPSDWMKRLACDTSDPNAFGVDIVGDSMEPNYREGETVILAPGREARNGNLVVANVKRHGVLLKVFHIKGQSITLTSFNAAYPPQQFSTRDFHWIYPVETVIKRVLH